MSGWAEGPGGGMLARLIGDAFSRATESDAALSDPKEEQTDA